MKLEDLVPPLDLCKRIPEGEFEDSALVWWGACVYPRIKPGGGMHMDEEWHKRDALPAPTLQEIMEDLPQGVELSKDSEWFCSLSMTNEYYSEKVSTAAMKVWLELEGKKNDKRRQTPAENK